MPPESLTHMAKATPERIPPSQEELRIKLEKRFQSMEPLIEQGMKEYRQALKDHLFEDQDGEEEGSGEKRREEMQNKLDTLNFSPELVLPQDLGYTAKKDDTDESKYGEYTLNPDTLSLDYDSIPQDKIKILTLPDTLNNQPLDQVANYILQTYPNFHIPGLEYYKYIIQNPTKAPQALKDGNIHFFFGSLFRHSGGHWFVPCVGWGGSSFNRDGYWLG